MRLCQRIALSQFKCLSMKLVPIVDILKDLDAVVGFEDSVGSDDLVLTPEDQAELAILSNMCGLWSWKFKPHLDKSLDSLQVVDASLSVEGVPVSPFPLFATLDAAEQNNMLVWYVGLHPRAPTKFTYRTFTTKGGLIRKAKGPPIPQGSFDSPEAAAENLLELAVQLEIWSPPPSAERGCWSHIDHLCRSAMARVLPVSVEVAA